VVAAARAALDSGDPKPVLIWVSAEDEAQVRAALADAAAVRRLGEPAQALADRYFFETVVRLHRAGEGAPYTGLKPAGGDLGPAIPAADKALRDGSVEPLVELLTEGIAHDIRRHFAAADTRKGFDPQDVEAGRRYVDAYVHFMHAVERTHAAGAGPAHGDAHGAGADAHAD
jgi:hypothetical protein